MITIDGSQGEGGGQTNAVLKPSGIHEVRETQLFWLHVAGVFTGLGERGRRAEEVARSAVVAAKAWLDAGVSVDEHLADQLLIPMVLAGGGSFRTTKPSLHTNTNAAVIQRFLPAPISIEQVSENAWRVRNPDDRKCS